eukprot:CAMPEP_0201547834 /NCGR_PEP_ID=MMETSP0173_2-20130828/4338_1 /ASSEMBLY_ACC=CAM_ASM_000268 /TAXON_ID=218659 /ORGANISM="Vexillifera sp., Strain DIVA3 564/2" /LENGTH=353 /DNA_ID=CAMNT_0047957015 /DNA_START=568 /DNA_END=1626 /DNA_ORIENTATION=-
MFTSALRTCVATTSFSSNIFTTSRWLHTSQDQTIVNSTSYPITDKPIGLIGCPIDLGAGKRGVDMGPFSLRHAQITPRLRSELGLEVNDHGNIYVPQSGDIEVVDEAARFWPVIEKVLADLSAATERIYASGEFPVTLGGDHVLAAGSLSGVQRARRKAGELDLGFLWLDAHTDMNCPLTTPSGNMHGMSAAALLGIDVKGASSVVGEDGWFDPARTAWVGIRDVDREEARNLEQKGLVVGRNIFTMTEIDSLGIGEVMRRALNACAAGGSQFALSVDVDAVDPSEAPGVGTPVPGGLTFREAHYAMELCAEHGGLTAMDLVEVNPLLDNHNQTAETAIGLLLSALGKRTIML